MYGSRLPDQQYSTVAGNIPAEGNSLNNINILTGRIQHKILKNTSFFISLGGILVFRAMPKGLRLRSVIDLYYKIVHYNDD